MKKTKLIKSLLVTPIVIVPITANSCSKKTNNNDSYALGNKIVNYIDTTMSNKANYKIAGSSNIKIDSINFYQTSNNAQHGDSKAITKKYAQNYVTQYADKTTANGNTTYTIKNSTLTNQDSTSSKAFANKPFFGTMVLTIENNGQKVPVETNFNLDMNFTVQGTGNSVNNNKIESANIQGLDAKTTFTSLLMFTIPLEILLQIKTFNAQDATAFTKFFNYANYNNVYDIAFKGNDPKVKFVPEQDKPYAGMISMTAPQSGFNFPKGFKLPTVGTPDNTLVVGHNITTPMAWTYNATDALMDVGTIKIDAPMLL